MIRAPAVAGRFYPGVAEELSQQVKTFCARSNKIAPRRAIACMVPHAGYRYSGHVAGAVYALLRLPRKIILIGPRHFPRGAAQAINSQGAWQTPFGRAKIDEPMAADLKKSF